jgi:hypothetical protein
VKRCIITVKIDISKHLPIAWESMPKQDIIEYFGDTPADIQDGDFVPDKHGNIIWEVERE